MDYHQHLTKAVLVPDTNLFLDHFEFLKDLITELPSPTLELLVPFTVLQELDRLKVKL
jgi:rRNA-processing protein FCF1